MYHMEHIRGVASLPSEILALVFAMAIFGVPDTESEPPRAFAAVRLSHVCSQFRDTILSTPLLWSEVRTTAEHPELELAQACVARSKESPLDVHLNMYSNLDGDTKEKSICICDDVLFIVLPHAHRWRSLHVTFNDYRDFNGSSGALESAKNVSAPNLEKIVEIRLDDESSIDRRMEFYSSWNMPMLRKLVLLECLPLSLPDLTAITYLEVVLSDSYHNATLFNLNKVLSRTPSLWILIIHVPDLTQVENEEGISTWSNITLNNVRTFSVSFSPFQISIEYAHNLITLRTFFSKLYFPNATDLGIEYIGLCRKLEYINTRDILSLLSDERRVPRLRSLHVNICMKRLLTGPKGLFSSIPTGLPAGLESLTFTCNTHLTMENYDLKEKVKLPQLRTLILDVARYRHDDSAALARWVLWLVGSLRIEGGWDTFRGLQFLERDWSNNRIGPESGTFIPRDEVDVWCNAVSHSVLRSFNNLTDRVLNLLRT